MDQPIDWCEKSNWIAHHEHLWLDSHILRNKLSERCITNCLREAWRFGLGVSGGKRKLDLNALYRNIMLFQKPRGMHLYLGNYSVLNYVRQC